MTERLYRSDPYRTRFDARVVERCSHDGQPAVMLDRTCFYATAGGQPHDLGTLGGVAVLDVVELDDQRILHVLSEPLPEGVVVAGEIDWARRHDHMQQHTAQHILSQAWLQSAGAETLSFHLGADECTIDIALKNASPVQVQAAEDLANTVIWRNLPVTVNEYSPDALGDVLLRKLPGTHERIRVVAVGDFDYSACGGTHLAASAEAGMVLIVATKAHQGGTRVSFVVGRRALAYHRRLSQAANLAARALSIHVDELPEAIIRQQEALKAAHKRDQELTRRWLEAALERNWEQADCIAGYKLVDLELDITAESLPQAIQLLVSHPRTVAMVTSRAPAVQIALAADAPVGMHLGNLLCEVLGEFGGKGGGSPVLARGGGLAAEATPKVLERLKQSLSDHLSMDSEQETGEER
ncbi:MAG: alanyl-tRNA editing protein [Chloroflexi bacterium]|nr:alanyl-tRNA editing protein [Chloroflexota bacterium]